MFRFPWLISRRKLIFNSLSEIILIFLLNKYLLFKYLVFASNIEIFTITFLPFWLLFSYIFGRYSYDDLVPENNYFIIFFKLYFISIFTILISIIFVFTISYNVNLNNYNHYDKAIIAYSILSSFAINFIQYPLVYRLIKKSSKKEKWIFIGSNQLFSLIINELKWSRKKIKLIYKDLDYDFSNLKLDNIQGIFFDNLDDISLKNLFIFERRGIKFMNIEKWCQNYLQRLPLDLLSSKYMIKGNFKIYKKTFQLRIKRIGDLVLSLILLVFTSPIMLIAGLLIYLEDRKNIFYIQERVGINQTHFTLYKLRTMKSNAENGQAKWSKLNDKRVTKVGKFLRKSRLDELPQLLCVIRGEMSLIGPRPEREVFDNELKKIIPFYSSRYFIKPGLSGWAQVNYPYGASIDDSKKKLSYDLYYLRNFSVWLDFLILFKTIKMVFLGRGSLPNN